jgi:hypothetical protein
MWVKVWVCAVESHESTTTAFVARSEEAMLASLRDNWGAEIGEDEVSDENLVQYLCDGGLIIWTDCQVVDAEAVRHEADLDYLASTDPPRENGPVH